MKSVLQRVSRASVSVEDDIVGEITEGILVLFGVEKNDTFEKLDYHVRKIANLRIFADAAGKMNQSIQDVSGEILVVSQFTLAGDCQKGTRPSFDNAMPPTQAEELYHAFVSQLKANLPALQVKTGVFGAMMSVSLVNDGPVTFILEN